MSEPDFAGAVEYALGRLECELSPELVYHSVLHTRDDVLPGAERLAAIESVPADACLLLRTAAAFHDIGFIEQAVEHEAIGVRIATAVLPDFGFSTAQLEQIAGMIRATRLPQTPHTLLERILADADLDVLGRDTFFSRNAALRAEMATRGHPMSDVQWLSDQIRFLEGHSYFTDAARRLRAATKQSNLEALRRRLELATRGT